MPRPLRVFLCHAKEDKVIVRDLYHKLTSEGWIDVWLDEIKLLPGQEWDIEIEKAVEQADVVVVCLSNKSVDKEGYVQKELRFVLNIADEKPEGTIFVVPLRLDDCTVPRRIRAWQYVDYFPKNNQTWAYQRLIESLKLRTTKLGISVSRIANPTYMPDENKQARVEREPEANKEREHITEQKVKPNTFIPLEAKPKGESIFTSWWKRILFGVILGALTGVLVYLFVGPTQTDLIFEVSALSLGCGLAAWMIYPHKLSLVLIVLGFFIAGVIGYSGSPYYESHFRFFIDYGVLFGITAGALISRIFYWLKKIIEWQDRT